MLIHSFISSFSVSPVSKHLKLAFTKLFQHISDGYGQVRELVLTVCYMYPGILILILPYSNMCKRHTDRMRMINNADPNQSLIWVYTVQTT